MGKVVKRTTKESTRRGRWLPALPVLLLLGGCASSAPAPATSAPDREATAVSAAVPAPPEAAPATVVVTSVELREAAPGAVLSVIGDGSLVWTGYRDADDRLVVEIPDAAPGPEVGGTVPGSGVIAGVTVETDRVGGRPMTRIVIATSEPVEHSMSGEGSELEVVLTPIEMARMEPYYEPLPEVEALEVSPPAAPAPPPVAAEATEVAVRQVEPAAAAPAVAGTPDHPMVAPPAAGPAASRLASVEVVPTAKGTVVRIGGDGSVNYSTFALDAPKRFVVDLDGVINDSPDSTVPIGALEVERVRVAQFKSYPAPVARVVFDLATGVVPEIERTSDSLLVRFGTPVGSHGVTAAVAGPGAENGMDAGAQGGTEAIPTTDGYTVAAAVARSQTYAVPAALQEPEADDEDEEPAQSVGDLPQTEEDETLVMTNEPAAPDGGVQTTVEQEEAPSPAPEPPAPAERPASSTSDLELFKRSEVTIPASATAVSATQSFTPQTISGGERQYFGEPITMSLRDADLVETLRSFAVISGLNIVIQPGVRGSVTVQLEDVPWDQAFEQILKINGLGYELEGNIMRIAPISTLRAEAQERQQLEQARALSVPLLTVIKRLSYSNARQIAELLEKNSRSGRIGGVLSQRGSVLVDQRTNTLIINELPDNMDTVIAVIENLDIPEPQVMIEARIVETRKNFTRTLGINWSLDGVASAATGNTTGLVFPATVEGQGGVNLLTGGSNGFIDLTLGTLADTFNLDVSLQAAENEGLINILSAPRVATLNNEQASIQSGFQIPIQTVANNTVSVQFVNATLRLDVTPQVTAEGTILMDIAIQKRNPEFAFAIQGATAAPINTKEARTRVIVRDGGTTVIGGIYEVTTNQGEDRVPGLANVPIIGHLFKNRRREDSNQELLIFITPRVIRI
jgi:type IV pilus assembly protein PilQ